MGEEAVSVNYRLFSNFIGHVDTVHSVKFSHNGKWLISASEDSRIKLWSIVNDEFMKDFIGHQYCVNDIDWSKDNNLIVSASDDRTLKIWDVERAKPLTTLQGHTSFVSSCKFNSQGTLIASSSYDETIRVWDTRTGNTIMVTPKQGDAVSCVAFNQDGSKFAGCSFNGICGIWELASTNLLLSIGASYAPLTNIRILPAGNLLLTAALDDCIKLWNTTNFTVAIYAGHENELYYIKADYIVNSAGTIHIVSGSEDALVYIWSSESQTVKQTLEGHSSAVVCATCHPSEEIIASTALNANAAGHFPIKIWKNV